MEKTVVTQWNLICENQLFAAHGVTSNMLGYLFGAFIGGYLGDRFGRKKSLIAGLLFCGIFGIMQAYMPIFWAFLFFRFLTGLTHMAFTMVAYVLQSEVTSTKHRALVGGTFVSYSIGYSLSSSAAYFVRDWRNLLILARLPLIPMAIFVWVFLPESPRWLLSVGQVAKGRKVIEKAAQCNGVTLSNAMELEAIAADIAQEEGPKKGKPGVLHILQYPTLALRTLNLIFCWSVNAMVYFGLMLNIGDFSGDLLLNNALNGLVEIPCHFLLMALARWSRKKPLVLFLFFAGLSLIIIPWIPNETVKLFLAFAGKFGITLTFSLIFLYTVELYPTSVRSSALGVCSMSARIGSLLSPYIAHISVSNPALRWVPMTIYGFVAIVSGLLICLGPETAGKRLPETFHEALSL